MDKNTVYILQKDLPNVNAGAEIKLSRAGTCYNCIDKNGLSASFQRKLIECNPDWFKVKEEPQWEILEFKNLRSGIVYIKKDNGKFNSGNGLDWDLEKFDIKDHEIINSVKRFPDNTVWSVDMVTEHGIITAFKIVGSTMVAEIKNNIFPYDYPLYLSELKAPKEEQVPIKVEGIMEIGLGQPQDKKGHIYMLTLVGNSKIPYEKTESIIQSINNELNKK